MAAKQKAFDIRQDTVENIIEKPIEKVLPDSMMPYSEYVIMERALPRVEDGLKPVQRRIIYTMHDLGMKPEGSYKKSARVVGECLGKYHPHGDTSVYDAMVRMAQDFNMRMTLVDGHGNFGSIDGDSAAAMRYTEVKMSPLATELVRDLDKGTVRWNKNFDDSLEEPDVLPGRFPNLLVNGAMGIAIGLATNIPTHNLTEVIDGCVAYIDNPNIKLSDMVKIIKGPDFPTGGFLVGGNSITEMYETGHGKLILRARADIENEGDKQNIVITEIPYNVNKELLQKKIFDLRETKKEILGGITDVADESDRNGMRVVVKLKKGEDAVKILNALFKWTDLQTNFNVNMVAIAGGKPKQLGLLQILKYYLEFQKNVILNRSKYDIAIAKKREHILEGFNLVIPAIDEVIAIIRNAPTRNEAKSGLRARFSLSDQQAEAILSLQLGNINKLDVTKFEKELAELKKNIEELSKIISSSREQYNVVKRELLEIRDKYKTKRLTTIVESIDELEIKPYDPTKRTAKKSFLAVDGDGLIKQVSVRNFISAVRDAESSTCEGLTCALAKCEPENVTLIFGNMGNCYRADTEAIKEKRWTEKGVKLSDCYPGAPGNEKAVSFACFKPDSAEEKEYYLYTKQGYVKKTSLKNYIVNKDYYQAISLKEGDEVIGGDEVFEGATLVFVTSDGLVVHTTTDDYPQQGRIAGGVIGVNLNDGCEVVYASQTDVEPDRAENGDAIFSPVGEIAVMTDKGYGKKVVISEFEPMKRNRKGIKIIDLDENGKIVFASKVTEPFQIGILDAENNLTVTDTESIRLDGRAGKGKPVVRGVKISKIIRHIEEI